ncbi:MAG: hypothetical protein JW761_12710 [Prolixibacteraceae bacterium]|nr:hypothetical protein [Prolixibacteraceae bacterium]
MNQASLLIFPIYPVISVEGTLNLTRWGNHKKVSTGRDIEYENSAEGLNIEMPLIEYGSNKTSSVNISRENIMNTHNFRTKNICF